MAFIRGIVLDFHRLSACLLVLQGLPRNLFQDANLSLHPTAVAQGSTIAEDTLLGVNTCRPKTTGGTLSAFYTLYRLSGVVCDGPHISLSHHG